nr:glycosyltransferase [uncultured Methanobrevibacter sp.]
MLEKDLKLENNENELIDYLFDSIPNHYSLENNYSDSYLSKYSDLIEGYNKNYFSDQIVIGIFLKGNHNSYPPTAFIRMIIPFFHIFERKNIKPYLIYQNEYEKFQKESTFLEKKVFDIIIIQRDCLDNATADFIVNICKKFNTKLIYEIDDDLMNIDKNHPEYEFYIKKKEIIEFIVSNADLVTVSTEALKNKLLYLNQNCVVIKNSLNNLLKTNFSPKTLSNTIKIGYMGSFTHGNDLKIIKNVVFQVKKYFENSPVEIIFEIIGGCREKIDGIDIIEIPRNSSEYPKFMFWIKNNINWDIGIAPLEDNNINKSKSEIKYLEYSSWGFAGVYSDVGPYSRVVDNYKNGILIKNNDCDGWVNAIIDLIENNELYNDIRKNAFEDINANYSLDSFIDLWITQINDLLDFDKQIVFNKENKYKLFLNSNFKNDYDKIKKSGIFNEEYYIAKYDEVKKMNVDPIYHYLIIGCLKGYNPSKKFNTRKYIKKNNIDVNKINPLIYHFENSSQTNNDLKSKLKDHDSLKVFIKGYRFLKKKI